MPAIIPADLLKEYEENYRQHGHVEAMRTLRQKIVWRTSTRFYGMYKDAIHEEVSVLESLTNGPT